jgi:hypothetical protein
VTKEIKYLCQENIQRPRLSQVADASPDLAVVGSNSAIDARLCYAKRVLVLYVDCMKKHIDEHIVSLSLCQVEQ